MCRIWKKTNQNNATMSLNQKDLVVLLEDEEPIRKGFSNMFTDLELDIELHCCKTPDEYSTFIQNGENKTRLRALIMDLSNTPEENNANDEDVKTFAAAKFILEEYNGNRIPIFVHSSKLQHFDDLDDKGTVWKIEKGQDSIENVCRKIKLMLDTDFLNIFRLGGRLESKIMEEVHKAFVNQFEKDEIEEITNSIVSVGEENISERVTEVFERIAIRSVYENWVSAKEVEGKLTEKKFNAFEHYYRRTSDYQIWTGDVFQSTENKEMAIVLTPRCNVGHDNYDELLLCRVIELGGQKLEEITHPKKGEERLRKNITDDVTITGERYRFLPRTPQFEGGVVDYKTMFTMKKEDFVNRFDNRLISLSDELTNDVVRKLTAYLSRGGISETEFSEAHNYLINNKDKGEAVE